MDFKCFYCSEDDEGRRLDKILKIILKDMNQNVYNLLRKKLVRVNGLKAQPDQKAFNHDKIEIASFLFENSGLSPENQEKKPSSGSQKEGLPSYGNLKTVYRNEHLLFIQKPKGMNVQNATADDTSIASIIKSEFKGSSLSFTPAPLHRLDRQTSGLLAVSLSYKGALWFSEKIRTHEIRKIYTAVVQGNMEKSMVLEDYITGGSRDENGFYTVTEDAERLEKNRSVTVATPLSHGILEGKEITLVQFEIKTGHKHQIRFQSSRAGFPLTGDRSYGGSFGPFLLHSTFMIFEKDNEAGLPEVIRCPFTEEFDDFLKYNLKKWEGTFIL